jgi:diguanylate cyclase (GGDEF)-like protein
MDTLETEVRRAKRSKHLFALLLLDLDELKAINEKYGHLVEIVRSKRLSEVIKDQSRGTDVAARYGGDEFAVVLIDADPGMANRLAQRVEKTLHDGWERPRLSVSIGISVYPEDGAQRQNCWNPRTGSCTNVKRYKRKKAAHAQGVSAV